MEANTSLMELLEGIHDPRGARGKRHPLSALLALAVVSMLAGQTSYEAIVDYGQKRGGEFLRLLGFTRRRGLCKATYSRVFRRIDVVDFEARVGQWVRGRLGPGAAPHLAFDGKTARGSRDGDTPGVHLVSAYAPDVKAVVGQLRVDAKTNEHKAALELLGILPIAGKVVTGDAMFTHRDVCATVIGKGGEYVLPVKENQPTLLKDIAAVFPQPVAHSVETEPSPPPGPAILGCETVADPDGAGLSPPRDRGLRGQDRACQHDRQRARSHREANDRGHFGPGEISQIGLARL